MLGPIGPRASRERVNLVSPHPFRNSIFLKTIALTVISGLYLQTCDTAPHFRGHPLPPLSEYDEVWKWVTDIPFYVTEGSFMHLTVSCQFLICCVIQVYSPVGGGGLGGRVITNIMTLLFPPQSEQGRNFTSPPCFLFSIQYSTFPPLKE